MLRSPRLYIIVASLVLLALLATALARVLFTFEPIRVGATAYNAHFSQTDSTPRITATGTTVRQGRTLATSTDLWRATLVRPGDVVRVSFPDLPEYEGRYGGLYIVEDAMNRRFRRTIDLYLNSYREATTFGRVDALIERLDPRTLPEEFRNDPVNLEAMRKGQEHYRRFLRALGRSAP
ncbi:MAG: 3D domain-containing protein [Deinococcus sp.]|nr:3D domain-containing protein [Deinococcus sp.]